MKIRDLLPGAAAVMAVSAVLGLCAAPGALAQTTLDRESAECIGCHQTYADPSQPGLVCHAEGCNHAIGLDYAAASAARPTLAPPAELGLALPGGRIGCTTCHVPYSAADHEALSARRGTVEPDPMLAVDNTGSALCLECHRM